MKTHVTVHWLLSKLVGKFKLNWAKKNLRNGDIKFNWPNTSGETFWSTYTVHCVCQSIISIPHAYLKFSHASTCHEPSYFIPVSRPTHCHSSFFLILNGSLFSFFISIVLLRLCSNCGLCYCVTMFFTSPGNTQQTKKLFSCAFSCFVFPMSCSVK